MDSAINFIIVALGFCSVVVGVIFLKRKKLLFLFVSIGLLMFAFPFVRNAVLTKDAYKWTIVVQRTLTDSGDPKVIFIDDIQWVTDYEKLKLRRGKVGSVLLNGKKTGKVWNVKGYVPLSIAANIVYGRDQIQIWKGLEGMEAGSYTFTLTFDENDRGKWTVSLNEAE